MKSRILALLGVLALGGWLAAPALAGDGSGEAPSSGTPAAKDGKACDGAAKEKASECKDAAKKVGGDDCGSKCGSGDCGDCGDCGGCGDGKGCCGEKMAQNPCFVVTLAAAAGDSDAAKKVLAAIPSDVAKKVEEARKAAFETVVKVSVEMASLKKECEALAEQAKAEGREMACEAKATFEEDGKALKKKCHEAMMGFGKLLTESLGAEKVQALAAELGKPADVAKAFGAKLDAAVKAAEDEKAKESTPAEETKPADEAKPPCKTKS